ncbi:DUF3179 domain-containing protein [Falsihalocynthiibacter arcticus]|uniref:DUF3179 domain-containing protein n=1 Tax=Falsihalocynthiibacter arcticus TaxID=1579316 RepID=A0A126V261_9RHOB|nr:DUF3179 domain-containing protein [Falsihalocynthiibacter arcticus]AML52412.1 hypothetical protein RC74_15040 [Falsihalocynthiibacter arcticus]
MTPKSHLLTLVFICSASLAAANPDAWKSEWPSTDFTTTTIDDWSEILSGGPPKDGIPALSDPSFIAVSDEAKIGGKEPVITLEIKGEAPRAYPIRYLTWHEIVNDDVGDTPVAVTFCPLCNSGMVFDRRLGGDLLTFGVSGKLRNSDMVMFDRETESWWQQAIGTGIVGAHTGDELTQLPAWMEGFDQFKARNPNGLVMKEPDWPRSYGQNPYRGYDSSSQPFLYRGENPPHGISPLMRVVRVGDAAWPLDRLSEVGEVTENGVKITWREGQTSVLDKADIATSREVGSIRVKDASTGADVPHDVLFAFAFHAFWPDGKWMLK